MATHRWTHGKPLHRHAPDETIELGDEFEPSEGEINAFNDRIEELEAESDDENVVVEPEVEVSDVQPLTDLDGVGEATADSLHEAGYTTVEDVRSESVENLVAVDGVGEALAADLSEVDE